MVMFKIYFGVLFLCLCVVSENLSLDATEPNENLPQSSSIVAGYNNSVNTSKILEADDRILLVKWGDDYQLRRLDTAMRYRLQMIKHHEHNFKSIGNIKWMECLHMHRRDIRRCSRYYYDSEHDCLKDATSKDNKYRDNVQNYEKEIIKWRRGYRYLAKLCKRENPKNEDSADQCLVEYMQNDKFDEVIHRLIHLKQRSVSDLLDYYNQSLIDLEKCLETALTGYLDKIRAVMENLDKCYKIKNNS